MMTMIASITTMMIATFINVINIIISIYTYMCTVRSFGMILVRWAWRREEQVRGGRLSWCWLSYISVSCIVRIGSFERRCGSRG